MPSLLDYVRPGFPKSTRDASGWKLYYELIGPATTIIPVLPAIGATWLDARPVTDVGYEPVGNSAWVVATIETYKIDTQAAAAVADEQYPFWEIDQVQVEKSIRQHPAFIAFTAADWAAVTNWENEQSPVLKTAYKYYERDSEGTPAGSIQDLTGTTAAGQVAYAYLRLRGVESFLDFAPVVRRNSRYIGSSAPDSSDAGQKTAAPAYAPDGYDWLKTADRISKQGSKGVEWIRQEEWTGARKILIDKDDLFIT